MVAPPCFLGPRFLQPGQARYRRYRPSYCTMRWVFRCTIRNVCSCGGNWVKLGGKDSRRCSHHVLQTIPENNIHVPPRYSTLALLAYSLALLAYSQALLALQRKMRTKKAIPVKSSRVVFFQSP